MVKIIPYNPIWRDEFLTIGRELRQHLGALALRIDHIGSTSAPGLAAKDIIDIQITVADLSPKLRRALDGTKLQRSRHESDHIPPGGDPSPEQWRKWLYKNLERPANVHIRLAGRANQRYALLFRDYLRAMPAVAQAYAQVKMGIIKYHPEPDMTAYYDIKDPVCDIIYGGAELWAKTVGWQPGETDC